MRFALLQLALAAIVLADDDWVVHNFHRHIVYPLKDSKDNLIYVTFSLDNRQAIQLDYHDGRKSCVVPHPLTYNSRSRQKLAVLGNGKVVTTMMNNQVSHDIRMAAKSIEWKLSIIDPTNCTYLHKVIGNKGKVFTNILPYVNTFDLDGKDNRVKKVVRFKDDGELEGFSAKIPDQLHMGIKMAKEYDPSQGYYYIVFNNKGRESTTTSTIRRLNSKFEVVKNYSLNHDIVVAFDPPSHSTTYGKVTFCSFKGDTMNLECIVIDADLTRELQKIQLTYEHKISETVVVNLKNNGFAVIDYHRHDRKLSTVYARHVNDKGEVGPVVTIGNVHDVIYKLYGYAMNDGKLCVVVVSGNDGDSVLTKFIHVE